jgi:hypothetical protein
MFDPVIAKLAVPVAGPANKGAGFVVGPAHVQLVLVIEESGPVHTAAVVEVDVQQVVEIGGVERVHIAAVVGVGVRPAVVIEEAEKACIVVVAVAVLAAVLAVGLRDARRT